MIRLVALAALLWAGSAFPQGPAKPAAAGTPAAVSQVCAACHGADGNSVAPANPKIAGQFSGYLYKQLADFQARTGRKPERDNAVMAGMTAALSDADMKSLASYYAGQTYKPAAARDKDLAAKGQRLFRGGNLASGVPACAGCHGPEGAGIPNLYPRIAGQFSEYVDAQLKAFRAGTRANDSNGMMRGVAARMSDEEIRAVAEYVAGLR